MLPGPTKYTPFSCVCSAAVHVCQVRSSTAIAEAHPSSRGAQPTGARQRQRSTAQATSTAIKTVKACFALGTPAQGRPYVQHHNTSNQARCHHSCPSVLFDNTVLTLWIPIPTITRTATTHSSLHHAEQVRPMPTAHWYQQHASTRRMTGRCSTQSGVPVWQQAGTAQAPELSVTTHSTGCTDRLALDNSPQNTFLTDGPPASKQTVECRALTTRTNKH
jgi:hypothetical protein